MRPCTDAERQLVESSLDLLSTVRFTRTPGLTHDEKIQEAAVGLMYAAQTHDPLRGASWATYAKNCIRWQLLHVCRDRVGDPRQPKGEAKRAAFDAGTVHFDAFDPDVLTIIGVEPDLAVDLVEQIERRERAQAVLAALPPDERTVVVSYAEGRTLREIADGLGITRGVAVSLLHSARARVGGLTRRSRHIAVREYEPPKPRPTDAERLHLDRDAYTERMRDFWSWVAEQRRAAS